MERATHRSRFFTRVGSLLLLPGIGHTSAAHPFPAARHLLIFPSFCLSHLLFRTSHTHSHPLLSPVDLSVAQKHRACFWPFSTNLIYSGFWVSERVRLISEASPDSLRISTQDQCLEKPSTLEIAETPINNRLLKTFGDQVERPFDTSGDRVAPAAWFVAEESVSANTFLLPLRCLPVGFSRPAYFTPACRPSPTHSSCKHCLPI